MSPPIRPVACSQMAVFLINSRLGLLSAAPYSFKLEPHFFRSYVCILPSSLTRGRSCALGYSPHLRVSVYGTVIYTWPSHCFPAPWLRPLRLDFLSSRPRLPSGRHLARPSKGRRLDRDNRRPAGFRLMRHGIEIYTVSESSPISHRLRVSASP